MTETYEKASQKRWYREAIGALRARSRGISPGLVGQGKPPAGRGTWAETLKMNLAGKEGREEASRQKEHAVQLFCDMRMAGGHQRLMEASMAPAGQAPGVE